MKNFKFIYIISILFASTMYGQTPNKNYVKSISYQVETQDGVVLDENKYEQTTYFDGIGRPQQSVTQRAGGNGEDLIVPMKYDNFGRQPREYLPYPLVGNNGEWVANPYTPLHSYYYNNYVNDRQAVDINPYSEKRFEESPVTSLLEQGAPGGDWEINPNSDSDNTIKFEYAANNADNLYRFRVTFSGGNTSEPQLNFNGWYPNSSGFITKTVTKDENWKPGDDRNRTTHEFTNNLGQTILKRTFNRKGSTQQILSTYYIYDDYGNLTFVLSPEASKQIISSGALVSNYQTILDELGYQYKYDDRNRLIRKKIPGKGWEYIIYDVLDRPVLTQDENLRQDNNKWLFTKYDQLNRIVYTGIYSAGSSRTLEDVENAVENQTALQLSETRRSFGTPQVGGTDLFYTNSAYPTSSLEVLTVNYYDDYVHHTGAVLPSDVYGVNPNLSNTMGLTTVTRVKVLDTSDWIVTMAGYDEKGRSICGVEYNQYLNVNNTTKQLLDFAGKINETTTTHLRAGNSTITTIDYFTYDSAGRVVQHSQKIDDEPVQLIAENEYDPTGMLVVKDVGGQTLTDGFTDLKDVEVSSSGTISCTTAAGSWPARALTRGEIPTDTNGELSLNISQTGKHVRFGFVKSTNASQINKYYDYGIHTYYNNATGQSYIRIVIEGLGSTGNYGVYNAGDQFRIERDGTSIRFFHNSTEFHTITDAAVPDDALIGKTSFSIANGASVENLAISSGALDKKLQEVNYSYNIRGWLRNINDVDGFTAGSGSDDLFHFRINYNEVQGTYGTPSDVVPLYNGNIAETIWRTENDNPDKRSYGYLYDDLNRIRKAGSRTGTNLDIKDNNYTFTLWNVGYDQNGNIQSLRRSGKFASQYYDDLGYTYQVVNGISTNKLQNVKDGGFDSQCQTVNCTGFEKGFVDGNDPFNTLQPDYAYDGNGNLTIDRNKGIHSISYNHLNLPKRVSNMEPAGGEYLDFIYDATGVKQAKVLTSIDAGVTTIITTEYSGGYVYLKQNSDPSLLQFIDQPEGYIEPTPVLPPAEGGKSVKGFSTSTGQTTYSEYAYIFQYKDHLGSVRLSYTDGNLDGSIDPNDEIIEESNYFPFGLRHWGYNDVTEGGNDIAQKWKYQGQEFEEELGKDTYAYQWRDYDPAIGRFGKIDRFAEKYYENTPYHFTKNNPAYFREIKGDSINVSNLIFKDGKLNKEGLYVLYNVVSDLQDITGTKISVNSSGNLLSEDGKKDASGKLGGSEKARKYFNSLVSSSSVIKVGNDNSKSTQGGGIGNVNINSDQIDGNIQAAKNAGIDELAFGYGMSFLHETLHTATGTRAINPSATSVFSDPPRTRLYDTGPTVDKINEFRDQLMLPTRSNYYWTKSSVSSPATMEWDVSGRRVWMTKTTMSPSDQAARRKPINNLINLVPAFNR